RRRVSSEIPSSRAASPALRLFLGIAYASYTSRPRYSAATGVPRRVAELRTHPSNLIRLVPAKGGCVETPNWGIEPVPERLRVLGVFDSMLLWTNLSISLLVLVAASYFD